MIDLLELLERFYRERGEGEWFAPLPEKSEITSNIYEPRHGEKLKELVSEYDPLDILYALGEEYGSVYLANLARFVTLREPRGRGKIEALQTLELLSERVSGTLDTLKKLDPLATNIDSMRENFTSFQALLDFAIYNYQVENNLLG